MPDATTAHLALPLLQAAQAQKHVTHNEALMGLDTLVQLAVLDKDLTAPPASPAEGDRYLIAAAAPTGAWAGWAGRVVRYQDGAWRSFVPRPGWLAVVADEADLYTYTGAAWSSYRSTLTALQNLARLGIGTTADAANPFAAKLNKALWTALTTGEGGTGDLRYTLNKQDAGNTLSLLLQSGFSGRAEIGLTGDDDLRLKVSADGGTWREALRVEAATGAVSVAQAVTCGNPGLQTGVGLVVRESAHASGSRRATIALGSGWQINQDSLATGGRDFSLYSTALGRSALAVATSGQVTVSDGLNVGGGLTLNNGTGNTLQFASAGVAAPSTGGRSAGTKLVLYPNVSATEADFAVGIEIGAMWHSIPHSGTFYRWYAGSAQRMQLDGNGNLSAAGKITGTGFVSSAGDGATGLSVNVGNGYLSYQTFGASSFIWNYGTALFIGTSSAHSVTIATNNVARMTVAATGDVGMSGNLTVAGRLRPGSFTVATVPAGVAGDLVHVSNARKVGEAAGSGTGVLSYYSNGNWRRLSDDGPVAA